MARKNINMFNVPALLIIGFIVGLATMYLYFQPKITQFEQQLSDNKSTLEAYKALLSAKPTPAPATQPSSYFNRDSMLPEGCSVSIKAYMDLGYSRFTTNQMLKTWRPECTY